MKSVIVPSKAILFGEHAAVYPGHSIVIVPVPGVTCKVTILPDEAASNVVKITDTTLHLNCIFAAKELQDYLVTARKNYQLFDQTLDIARLRIYKDPANYLKLVMAIGLDYLEQNGVIPRPTHLQLTSSLSQCGTGSSAAVAASLLKAYMIRHDLELSRDEWYKLTLQCEQFQHGRPSGGDPAAVTYGQPICLAKNQDGSRTITPLPDDVIPHEILRHCYIVHTGRPQQSTGEMVAYVRGQYEQDPTIIDAVETNTQKFLNLVCRGALREDEFCSLINANGRMLEDLGIVTKAGLDVIKYIRVGGGAAKLSGSGGLGDGPCGAVLVYLQDSSYLRELAQRYTIYPIVGKGSKK